MPLSKEQEQFYQQTLDMTRKQIDDLNAQIEEELAKVKERLADLQNAQERRQADLRRGLQDPRRRERPGRGPRSAAGRE